MLSHEEKNNEPDLHPRTLASEASPQQKSSPRKKVGIGVFLVVVLVGVGFLLYTTLSNASLFFLDVDEAVERRDELGTERFRVQGITVPESIDRDADVLNPNTGERQNVVIFRIAFNGEVANVVHRGGLADIFADCLPVILEGRWEEGGEDVFAESAPYYFESSEMLVKHDNDYTPSDNYETSGEQYGTQNPNRIQDADSGTGTDPLRGCPQT